MNFDFGEILTRASQITWEHRVLWVFNIFPVLFNFLFVPVVFIPMFFIGPYSLVRQGAIDQRYYISYFLKTDLVLAILAILLYTVGAASSTQGGLRVENGRKELPFRDGPAVHPGAGRGCGHDLHYVSFYIIYLSSICV